MNVNGQATVEHRRLAAAEPTAQERRRRSDAPDGARLVAPAERGRSRQPNGPIACTHGEISTIDVIAGRG